MDTFIKANCTTQVIPSANAIAKEVVRHQHAQNYEEHGAGVSRERWIDHTTLSDMVRGFGTAYRGTDDEGREVYCPVCLKYRAGDGREVITVSRRLPATRKLIARHLATHMHKQALKEEQREATRGVRRNNVGLIIARTTLQTLREGASYVQFERKLHSLHRAWVDIGFLNHSREFIRGFVDIMTYVMDRRIGEYARAVDPLTDRKRVFAFIAGKATELHRTRDLHV